MSLKGKKKSMKNFYKAKRLTLNETESEILGNYYY
jgi:hypothetical protein